MFSAVTFLIANCTSFGYKSVFPDATFVAAKCTFWDQVCVFRCNLFRCKVYILGSSLCFQLQPLSLQSVHFWGEVCVFRCDFCRCKVYILGSNLCFQMRLLSLQSVHFGIKSVFSDATFVSAKCIFWGEVCVLRCDLVSAKCTFWGEVCVFRCDLCRYKVYILG